MELHGVDILLFEDGGKFCSVRAGRNRGFIRVARGVRMSEIEVCVFGDALQQARLALYRDLIPAHVRELYVGWQSADSSWQQMQTVQLRRFFAGFIQDLQPEADAQERHASMDCID